MKQYASSNESSLAQEQHNSAGRFSEIYDKSNDEVNGQNKMTKNPIRKANAAVDIAELSSDHVPENWSDVHETIGAAPSPRKYSSRNIIPYVLFHFLQ
jgi:hypothetical protein